MSECPICKRETIIYPFGGRKDIKIVCCQTCGNYLIEGDAERFLPRWASDDRLLLKRLERYLWETREAEHRLIVNRLSPAFQEISDKQIDIATAKELYSDDGGPLQKLEKAVRRLADSSKIYGQTFNSEDDRWMIPSLDEDEADAIIHALDEYGYISISSEADGCIEYTLTASGLAYAAELGNQAKFDGSVVFVAASFSDEMKEVRDSIKNVLCELHYKPVFVNELPHNNLIELEIYQNIRESAFVIADLTWNRQSVYYEIGFAHGLGLEVVLTCREDCFSHGTADRICNDGHPCDYKRVHFDINHRNVLRWNNIEELEKKLRSHIYQSPGPYKPKD